MRLIPITLILTVVFSLSVNAQLPIDSETGKVIFSNVIHLDDMTKEEINKKAKSWIVTTLKSGDNMVELSGTNSDQVVGTGNIDLSNDEIDYSTNETLNFKFIVKCKDGKLKYSIENFNLSFLTGGIAPSLKTTCLENIEPFAPLKKNGQKKKFDIERENQIQTVVRKKIELLINDFISYMKKTEEDW